MWGRILPLSLCCTLMLLASVLLGACDTRNEWQSGAYQLRWIDTPELFLVYTNDKGRSMTLIDADIIGIGSDEKHIIVRHRHHLSREISYFVIDKQASNTHNNAQAVPLRHLSEEEYRSQAAQTSWPNINREFHYP